MARESELKRVQRKVQGLVDETNAEIDALGVRAQDLHGALTDIQTTFDAIRNVPTDEVLEYETLKGVRLEWRRQVEKIESDYKEAASKSAGAGVAGAGLGVAVAAMGPTAAMGVATTFGVASTGTAISALSGAAATNAALAWLGGGALAAGGGGMAAGSAFLAMAGPIGWTIAGVALLGSGAMLLKHGGSKRRLDSIYTLIGERDAKSYQLSIVELKERILRIASEARLLRNANADILTFGTDYTRMTELKQYALGSYVNLMRSSTQLLVNPILGLQPKYSEEDLERYLSKIYNQRRVEHYRRCHALIIALANMLYKIRLNEQDRMLLWTTLSENDELIRAAGIEKADFDLDIINATMSALKDKYGKRL